MPHFGHHIGETAFIWPMSSKIDGILDESLYDGHVTGSLNVMSTRFTVRIYTYAGGIQAVVRVVRGEPGASSS